MMDKAILGPKMMGAVDALSDEEKADRNKVFVAMAGAIIEHIQMFGEIQGVLGPGLATGPGGGPVAGAIVVPLPAIK